MLTDDQYKSFKDGNLYVNVHSAEHKGGEIRTLQALNPVIAARREMHPHAMLIDRASAPYRGAGRFAYYFARGKLQADPVFHALLELGLLRDRKHILDLGCGQGLLTAWLRAAAANHENGSWPQGWPPPPSSRIRGIELMARDVERARVALGPLCEISQGDIRTAEFGSADAVVILDVLHYMTDEEQLQVLARARHIAGGRAVAACRRAMAACASLQPVGRQDRDDVARSFAREDVLPQHAWAGCCRTAVRGAVQTHEPGHTLRKCVAGRKTM